MEEMELDYEDCGLKFIWGVKSYDDLTSCDANLYTMNDIDICYDEQRQVYMLGVEMAYIFNTAAEEAEYFESLLARFTKYMTANNLDTNCKFDFFMGAPYTSVEARSIPELYTNFRIFVEGYKAIYGTGE